MSIKHLLFAAGLATVAACANPGPFADCSPEPGTDQEETVCSQNYHPDGTGSGLPQVVADEDE